MQPIGGEPSLPFYDHRTDRDSCHMYWAEIRSSKTVVYTVDNITETSTVTTDSRGPEDGHTEESLV